MLTAGAAAAATYAALHPGREPLLSAAALSAGYERPVVGPVNLAVWRGDVLTVRGANGSGKSTLLNALAGGAHIFSGAVTKQPGLRISHQQQAALPLNHVPLSGRELLALTGAEPNHLPQWIAPLVDRRLDRLSGGQLQFLQVWACLAAPVDLVLLDEPTNNVDPAGVQHLRSQIIELRQSRGFLVVSHDQSFLDDVGTHTLRLG
jgi:zinc transport system ATP-binding protein